MKKQVIAFLVTILASSFSHGYDSIAQQVFNYECQQLNHLDCKFQCLYRGLGDLTFHIEKDFDEKDEYCQYEFGKVLLRYAAYGGELYKTTYESKGDDYYRKHQITNRNGRYLMWECSIASGQCE